MRLPLMASLGLWLTALALAPTPAAASYGSLDEQPATGGELRLATPAADDTGRVAVRFPLLHTRVRADVVGAMAEVEVEQTWHNPYAVPIEAVYVFPLSARAAVNAYAIDIGERTVEGVIRERDEALQVYEDARDRGQTAGLVEQDARDIFVQHIANIAPGEQIVTRFRYAEMLDYEHATGFRFHYPLTITPRYLGAGDTATTRQPDYVEPTRSGATVDIEVRIDAGMPIRLFRCYTH